MTGSMVASSQELPMSSASPSSMPATSSTSMSYCLSARGRSEALSTRRRTHCWQIWLKSSNAMSLSTWVPSILSWCMYFLCVVQTNRVTCNVFTCYMQCFWHGVATLLSHMPVTPPRWISQQRLLSYSLHQLILDSTVVSHLSFLFIKWHHATQRLDRTWRYTQACEAFLVRMESNSNTADTAKVCPSTGLLLVS